MDIRGNIGELYVLSNGQIKDPLNLNSFHPLSTVNTLYVYLEDGGGDETATMINYKASKTRIPNSHNFPMLFRGLVEHTVSGEVAPRTFAKYLTYIPTIVSRYNVNSNSAMSVEITLTQDSGFNFVGIFATTILLNAYEAPSENDIAYVTDEIDYGYYQYDGTIWELMEDSEIVAQLSTKQYNLGYIQIQGGNAPAVPITTLTDEQYKLIWQYMETLAGQDTLFQIDLDALELLVANTIDTVNNIIDGTQALDKILLPSGNTIEPEKTAPLLDDILVRNADGDLVNSQRLVEVEAEIDDIVDGTIVVGKAEQDQNGEVIDTTYDKIVNVNTKVQGAKDYADNGLSLKENLSNKSINLSDVNDIKYPTTQAVKTETDKKVNKTQTIIGIDLQDNIELAEFKTALGNATTTLDGLMSSEDKTHLDTLVALLEDSDADSIVNTIQEILNIFENYPEGADLVTVLAGKVDKVLGKSLVSDTEITKLKELDTQAQLDTKFDAKVDRNLTPYPVLLSSNSEGVEQLYIYDNGVAKRISLDEVAAYTNAAAGAFQSSATYTDLTSGASIMVLIHDALLVSGGDYKVDLKSVTRDKLVFIKFPTVTSTDDLRFSTDNGTTYYNVTKNGANFKANIVSGQLVRLEFNGTNFIADIQGDVEIEETYEGRIESTYGEFNPLDNGVPLIKEIQGHTIPALENLVTNGNFETGDTTGWGTQIATVVNEELVVDNNQVSFAEQSISTNINDIIYYSLFAYNNGSGGINIFGRLDNANATLFNIIQPTTVKQKYSGAFTTPSGIDTFRIGRETAQIGIAYVDNVHLFNLTASHGVTSTSGTAYDNAVADIEAQLEANGGYIDTTPATHVLNSEFKSVGKNLFTPFQDFESGIIQIDGSIIRPFASITVIDKNTIKIVTTNASSGGISDFIKVVPNTNYFVSGAGDFDLQTEASIGAYDDNFNFIERIDFEDGFNTGNSTYIRYGIRFEQVGTFTVTNTQIEQGTVATTYAPYNSETQLFNHTALRSTIDKTVYDKIRYENGQYVKDVYIDESDNTALATPLLANEVIDVDGTLIQESVTTVEQLQNIPTTYKLEYSMNTEQTTKTLVERDKLQQREIDSLEDRATTLEARKTTTNDIIIMSETAWATYEQVDGEVYGVYDESTFVITFYYGQAT